MTRHIVVIGKSGQLARALVQQARLFDCQVVSFGREACDLAASKSEIRQFANALPPCDGVIIAAAYTAVDAAEDDLETASQVNGVAPGVFAEICQERSIPIVHVSTDYVFQGNGEAPIQIDMPTHPINAYGRSKLDGEIAVLQNNMRAVILRTSWVFDGTGKNFLTTMLRLGSTRDYLTVVADQIGRPTYAGHLAMACLAAILRLIEDKDHKSGVYHVSGGGDAISWANFAIEIFAETKNERDHTVKIEPIASRDYPTPAKRPAYSVLDIRAFEQDFHMEMPDWKEGLKMALLERNL